MPKGSEFILSKNQIVPLTITDVTAEGNGVGRYEGMAVFVPRTAVGDVLLCRIVQVRKNYAYGIIHQLQKAAPVREQPDCRQFGKCGGCVYRHLTYAEELRLKQCQVADCFSRLGGLTCPVLPVLGCQSQDGYRNKAQIPFAMQDGEVRYGFYAPRSHRIIPSDGCKLHPPFFEQICALVTAYLKTHNLEAYDEIRHQGLLRHVYLRRAHFTAETMVCFVVTCEASTELRPLADKLMSQFRDIKSVVMNINPGRTNVILGKRCITLSGADTITDVMRGVRVRISPLAFYQVHTPQAERLYDVAEEFAQLSGSEVLLDLYCGIGTIGLSMASKVKRMIGVEVVPQAVQDAQENARLNGISNATFFCATAGEAAMKFAQQGIHPDVVILDPPRKGCEQAVLDAIVRMDPRRVVYVSCNPATAARDCATLAKAGYVTQCVQPVDLFPRTGHVECVVKLSRVAE